MTDNTQLNLGSGGDTIGTDDIAGVKYQRIKVGQGADGTYGDVSPTNPLYVGFGVLLGHGQKKVTTAGTDVALSSSSVPCRLVVVQALNINTMAVTIGVAGVEGGATGGETARTGIALYPNDPPQWWFTTNLNAVFLDSLVNGEGVSFNYFG